LDNNGQALREILKLYDYDESASTIQQIEGIVKIKHEYVLRQINYSYIRGLQVTIEFDENKYVGSGLFLFASVLERFLSQYVSVNSFIEMVAKTTQHPDTIIKTWKPQSGNQIIL
jgi:type VI secretion system protein ImpG